MNPDITDDDPFHLAARVALAPVLEALGVVGVSTGATTRTWTFEDDPSVPIHERRHQHEPMEPVQALALALALAIRDVDAEDDDQARGVRLALAEVLSSARETVGDEWETVVFYEFEAMPAGAGFRKAKVTVEPDRVVVQPVLDSDDDHVELVKRVGRLPRVSPKLGSSTRS